MIKTTGYTADSHIRSLAEAVILQSIEDLWNPLCKGESLSFFQGEEFVLCSEIAGISYIKRCAMLKMLADAGFELGHPNPWRRRVLETARQETEGGLSEGVPGLIHPTCSLGGGS